MKMIIYMEANWKYNKFAVKNHGLKPFLGEGDHMSITLKHSLQNRNTQTFANFVLYVLKRYPNVLSSTEFCSIPSYHI